MSKFFFIIFIIVIFTYLFFRSRKNNKISGVDISTTDHTIEQVNNTQSNDYIYRFLMKNNIDTLFHFTRLSNLDSILKYGIYPRDKVNSVCQSVIFNDQHRYDKRTNTSSLSISFPNHLMFFKYRMLDKNTQWVVIGLDASILYKKNCLFCFTNAASKMISNLPDRDLQGIEALEKLFVRHNSLENNLPMNFPTDPQAEVLVFDIIEPKYIKFIHTDSRSIELSSDKKIYFDKKYFNKRDNYLQNHWR